MGKGYKWQPATRWKWSVLVNLTQMYNKLKAEAVFEEDFNDIANLEDAIKLINAYGLQPYNGGNCPLCGSPSITEGVADDVMFYGIGKASKKLGKLEAVVIRHCENCDSFHLEFGGWSDVERFGRGKK